MNDCFAIGKQQWGTLNCSSTGNATTNLTYPLSFESIYNLTATSYRSNSEGNNAYPNACTTNAIAKASVTIGHYGTQKVYWYTVGIQQWGYSTARTATFPIAFTSYVYAAVGCPDTNYTSATATGVHSLTLTGLGIVVHGTKGWYFVIGKQQWGRGMAGTYNSLKTVMLPVAYSNQNYSLVASVGHASSDSGNYTRTVYMSSISTTSFKWASCFNQNNPTSFECGWITIGIQQWGDLVDYSRNQIVSFPISHQNSCYCVSITTTRRDGDAYNSWIVAKQKENFTINFYNTAINKNSASWCSIGH